MIGLLRVSEGRLTGGFSWAPMHGSRPMVARELRRASRELERSPARRSPEIQGNLGFLALVDSRYSFAIDSFTRAVKKSPGNAALLTDLSAAQIAAATADGKPYLFFEALDTVQQALRIEPMSPEARFNYAVTTEHLHLNLTARKAWEDFLDVETDPQWRKEAEQRLEKLCRPVAGERWLVLRRELETKNGHDYEASLQEALTRFPQQLRQWVQEMLLSRWATACVTGNAQQEERFYQAVSEIGQALGKNRGEQSIDDASSVLLKENCGPRNRLATGHKS